MAQQEIVAAIVTDGARICLAKRSSQVGSDRGLWHCITGYLDPSSSPLDQVLIELDEELGLNGDSISSVKKHPPFSIVHKDNEWLIHPFLVHTKVDNFTLNWENDAYLWIGQFSVIPENSVSWLPRILDIIRRSHAIVD